jgi:hypothetical protein
MEDRQRGREGCVRMRMVHEERMVAQMRWKGEKEKKTRALWSFVLLPNRRNCLTKWLTKKDSTLPVKLLLELKPTKSWLTSVRPH